MKKVLSIIVLVLLVSVTPIAAQDEISLRQMLVSMVVDSSFEGNLVGITWSVDDVITGSAVVDLYFNSAAASPGHARQFALASITGEETPLVAMAEEMVAVRYTVQGIDRGRLRQVVLASVTGEVSAVTEADLYVEIHGILFLRRQGTSLVQVENVIL